jgi:hypothetical protein
VPIGIYIIRDASVCVVPDLRAQAGSQLLRLALAHYLDTDISAWQIGRAANGARIVVQGPGRTAALSVTHSGDLLAVAVRPADHDHVGQGDAGGIGIDIERPRKRSYAKIARYLGWPDSLWARSVGPTQDEFLHLWTLWEALFKALPDSSLAELRAELTAAGRIRVGAAGDIGAPRWSGCSWHGPDGCWLSVVTHPPQSAVARLFRVDTLAGDVDSARIQTIIAPEGEFHF